MNREQISAAPAGIALEKGQIWSFEDQVLQVKHVGKHLAEIIRTKQPAKGSTRKPARVSAQFESIRAVTELLTTRRAVLGSVPS